MTSMASSTADDDDDDGFEDEDEEDEDDGGGGAVADDDGDGDDAPAPVEVNADVAADINSCYSKRERERRELGRSEAELAGPLVQYLPRLPWPLSTFDQASTARSTTHLQQQLLRSSRVSLLLLIKKNWTANSIKSKSVK